MTDPQSPPLSWDALPVLTDVVEAPDELPSGLSPADVPVLVDFDIPVFDFSSEMDALADALPEEPLSFPADLTLDELLSPEELLPEQSGSLDAEAMIGRLPSLDLNVPLPDDLDLGEVLPGFAMPEPADADPGSVPPVLESEWGAGSVTPDVSAFPVQDAWSVPPVAPASVVPTLAAVPEAVPEPVSDSFAAESLASHIPELDVIVDAVPAVSASTVVPDVSPVPPVAPASVVPTLAATPEAVPELTSASFAAESLASHIPELDVVVDAMPAVFESAAVPDVSPVRPSSVSELPPVPDAWSVPLVPPAMVAPTLAATPEAAPERVSDSFAAESLASHIPELDVMVDAVPAVFESVAVPDVSPVCSSPEPVLAAMPDAALVPSTAGVLPAADEGGFEFDLAAAEGEPPAGLAASFVQALDAPLEQSLPMAHHYPAGVSISLDSLPMGVLGGGLGLAVGQDAVAAGQDRELELAWARDLGAEPPFALTRQEAAPAVMAEPVVPPVAADAAHHAPSAGQVDVEAGIHLAGVKAIRPQPTAVMDGVATQSVVSPGLQAEALTNALYARVLPRMKVELALWMQDALEIQAKQLMSGVMQQLKEDFDMMLAEALRESLREAMSDAQQSKQGDQ